MVYNVSVCELCRPFEMAADDIILERCPMIRLKDVEMEYDNGT